MTTMSAPRGAVLTHESSRSERQMPFLHQVTMLAWRTLSTNLRVPASVLPGIIISVFFLFIYNATLGGAAQFFLRGESYLGFILPLSIVSSALSGASIAGQSIVRDIERGYFDKLMLTPVSRSALVLGPMIAGGVLLSAQTLIVMTLALLMGLQPATGLPGVLAVLGFAALLGVGFSGFTVGIALRTGSGAATQGSSFLFFPMSFLTATFVPIELLSGWLRTAAEWNPITYILEAMRGILNTGWEGDLIIRGLASCLALGGILFLWAMLSLRARTRRK